MRRIVGLCVVLMLCVSCVEEEAAQQELICTEEYAGSECTVFEIVNQERAQEGLSAYRFDVDLAQAARAHAKDMVERGYFSHESPDGGTFSERATGAGYEGFPSGENIAYGQPTAQQVMDAWMNSPGHKSNILSDKSTAIGVGMHEGYWVQVFGVDR